MNTTDIRLFVGDPIVDPTEQRLIARLQADLSCRGVPATLLANFMPGAGKPQIDLLVSVPNRSAHVEIKGADGAYALLGPVNGPWRQVLPDGTVRTLDRNYGRQALDGTFAISDSMRHARSRGALSTVATDFKRHIDTLLCLWPAIPAGSKFELPKHVRVIGYDDLVGHLLSAGPTLSWKDADWDAFARWLNVYQPVIDSPDEVRRRATLAVVTDYRVRALATSRSGLVDIVDVGVTDPNGASLGIDDVDRRVADGGPVAVVGASGAGKSFLAQHLMVRHCERERLVVWLRAGAYERGRLKELIARAMAPFSASRWDELIGAAPTLGIATTVVVDGLNECGSSDLSGVERFSG